MVNVRLYQFSFILLILLFSVSCFSMENNSEQLILYTDKSESVLGRPIRVDLYAVNLKTKISDINLSILKKDFGVVIDYAINDTIDKRWPNKKIQILKFKLYPRKTGSISIPSIASKNISSKEKIILVTKGETSLPVITLPKTPPYTQQQFIVHVEILSSNSTSRLSIDKKYEIDNFESIALPFERSKNKEGLYKLKIGWALTAITSGQHNIYLPPIEYSVSGVSRKKFFLTSTSINIKALPSYLPPTIPVGKVSIQSLSPKNIFFPLNSVFYWNIKLEGNLNNSYKLPAILRQITSKSHIQFLPVNSTRLIKPTSNSLSSEVNHSIPFKVLKSGFLSLPEIKLQYFDPNNGKIYTINYKGKRILALSIFWQAVIIIIISLILLYAFKTIYKKWGEFNYSKIKKEQALQELQKNNIRSAIYLLIEAEFWPKNLTILQWSERWKSKYQADDNFDGFINILSSYFYSVSKEHNPDDLSRQLQVLINSRRKL